ncbi:MAG: hypothetical protein Q9228_005466 [Teloschistes exilis]
MNRARVSQETVVWEDASHRQAQRGLSNLQAASCKEGLDLVLRDQNHSAKARAERHQKARNKSRNQNPESSSGSTSPQPLTIYAPLAECQETYAHTFFISAYVLAPRDTRTDHGFLELLPFLVDRLPSSSVLNLSLSVVAHCYFQAWQPDVRNVDHIIVQRLYSKALKALQRALQDPQQCTSDETLMAVCLLSFYEVRDPFHYSLHQSSILTFSPNNFTYPLRSTPSVQSCLGLKRRSMLMVSKALANTMPVDETPEIWHDPEQMPHNPAIMLDAICVEAANVLAAAAEPTFCSESEGLRYETTASILNRAKAVEDRFAAWESRVPEEWWPIPLPREVVPQEIVDAGFHGDYCDVYSNTSVCATLNNFRSTRLRTLCLLASYDQTESRSKRILQIQRTVDDILAAVPYMLGSKSEAAGMYETDFIYPCLPGQSISMAHYQTAAAFGGLTLFGPLRALFSFARFLRVDQMQFAGQQFRRLGVLYDVRMPPQSGAEPMR